MAVKIIDKTIKLIARTYSSSDRALNRMAIDIERLSKAQVPHDKGQLKASGYHKKIGILKYEIVYNKEYAAYQEWGGDGKRVVRKYSKAGKKKFYLRDPARLITSRALDYIKNEFAKIKL